MTQISTHLKSGPSAQTLELIRQFARQYQPAKRHPHSHATIYWRDDMQPLGEC